MRREEQGKNEKKKKKKLNPLELCKNNRKFILN